MDSSGARSQALVVGVTVQLISETDLDTGSNEMFCGPPKADFTTRLTLKASRSGDIPERHRYRVRDFIGPDGIVFSKIRVNDINERNYGSNTTDKTACRVVHTVDSETFIIEAQTADHLRRVNDDAGKTGSALNDDILSKVRITATDQNGREETCDKDITLTASANLPPDFQGYPVIQVGTLTRQELNLYPVAPDPERGTVRFSIRNPQPTGITFDFLESSQGYTGSDTNPHTLRYTRTLALASNGGIKTLLLTATDPDGASTDFSLRFNLHGESRPALDAEFVFGPAIPTLWAGDTGNTDIILTATGADKDNLDLTVRVTGGRGRVRAVEYTVAGADKYGIRVSPTRSTGYSTDAGPFGVIVTGTKAGKSGNAQSVLSGEIRVRPPKQPGWNLPSRIDLTLGTDLDFDQADYVTRNENASITYTKNRSSNPAKFTVVDDAGAAKASGRPIVLHPVALTAAHTPSTLLLEMTGDDGVTIHGDTQVYVNPVVTTPTEDKPTATQNIVFGTGDNPIYSDGSNEPSIDYALVHQAASTSAINWKTLQVQLRGVTSRSPAKVTLPRVGESASDSIRYVKGIKGTTAGDQRVWSRVQSMSGTWSDWVLSTIRTTIPPALVAPKLNIPSSIFQVRKGQVFRFNIYDYTEWGGDISQLRFWCRVQSPYRNLNITVADNGDVEVSTTGATQPLYTLLCQVSDKDNPSSQDRDTLQLRVLTSGGGGGGGGGGETPPPP